MSRSWPSATSCTTRWPWRMNWRGRRPWRWFDPRTVYPFDWDGLADSVRRTGRLVVVDDVNRMCGVAAEVLATAAERFDLTAPPCG